MIDRTALLHRALDEVCAKMGLSPEGVYFKPDAVVATAAAFACYQSDDAPDDIESLHRLTAELKEDFKAAYHSWHAKQLEL